MYVTNTVCDNSTIIKQPWNILKVMFEDDINLFASEQFLSYVQSAMSLDMAGDKNTFQNIL